MIRSGLGPRVRSTQGRIALLTVVVAAIAATLFALVGTSSAASPFAKSANASYPTSPPYPTSSGSVTFTPVASSCYQTYTVPSRTTKLEVRAEGSEGDDGVGVDGLGQGLPGGSGGLGSEVDTVVAVAPGETLYVGPASQAFAGGAGGLAGMYAGDQPTTAVGQAAEPSAGGDGGNASFVSTAPPTGGATGCVFTSAELSSVLVVAAGGGGGGGAGTAGQDGGDGGNEVSGFGGQIAAEPGQNGDAIPDWWVDTDLTPSDESSIQDYGAGGTNGAEVPADKTVCPSILPANLNSTSDSYQGGCAGNGGTGDTFLEPGFSPEASGDDSGLGDMYCPAGEAGADGVAMYGGDGGSGWQSPDVNDAAIDVTETAAQAFGSDAIKDVRGLIQQALQDTPDPTRSIITEESMEAEEADSSLWLNSNPLDTLADAIEADAGALAFGAFADLLENFEAQLFPSTPLYNVIGCGGEDGPGGTTADGEIPGSTTGGGGGGGGGWYGGGGGGAADDYTNSPGGGGGGAGASYIAGDSYSQTLAQTTGSQDGVAQVTMNPVETAPAIVDPSSGCVYGTAGCATGPTFTCVVEGACSETLDTTGYVNPWVSQTTGSTLPNGFGFAETVPGTEQYNAGQQANPGVGWTENDAPTSFTLEQGWNLYGQSLFPASQECSLTGPQGSQQVYDDALQATNPDGTGTFVLPTTTVDYSPGTLQQVSLNPDASSDSLIAEQAVFPSGTPVTLDASADYSTGCDYQVANDSGGTWTVTGSTNPNGVPVSNSSVVTLSSGSGSELAQPVGPGTATVTFTYTAGGVTKSSSQTLTVQPGVPSSIWIAQATSAHPLDSACVAGGGGLASLTVVPGQTGQFYVCAGYGNGVVEDVTNDITWSQDSGLNQTGLVVSPNTVGTTPGEFLVDDPEGGSIAQASYTGTVTATLIAWGGAGGYPAPTPVVASLPVTINWANPTSIAVTGGVGPSQDAMGGEPLQLSATATYDNGQTVDVSKLASWGTSDSNLAETTAGSGGAVQIPYYENGGYATITATLGGVSGTEQIPVESSTPPTITVTDANGGTVGLGQTDQMTAAAFIGGPLTQQLNPIVTWSSNQPSIATVDSSGVVTIVGGSQGQQVTIRATDGPYTGTFVVTVDLTHPSSITVTPGTSSMGSGGSLAYTATGHYPGGFSADVSSLVTWTTNQPSSVAEFDSYELSVAANPTGNPVAITVTASLGSASPATATVTEGVGAPTNLTVSPTATGYTQLSPGQTVQLSATAQFGSGSGATNVNVTNNVTWTSDNSSVVTVSKTGLVTAVGHTDSTTADVYASYTDHYGTIGSTNAAGYLLTLADPSSITLGVPQTTLLAGQFEYLTATGTFPDGSTANVTNYVTWSSTCPSNACDVNRGGFLEASGAQGATPTVTATAANGVSASTSAITMAGPVRVSPASPSTDTLTPDVPYTSRTFSVTGGSGSYAWSLTTPTDSGLSLSSTTGGSVQITGTPTDHLWQSWGTGTIYLDLTASDGNLQNQTGNSTVTVQVPIRLTQQSQTLSWTNSMPATVQPGSTIDLSQHGASASSGLGASYTVSDTNGGGLCSIQGTTLKFSPNETGVCSVTATANTNAEYAAAPSTVTEQVHVVAPLTDSWQYQAPAYVQADVGCGPSLTQLAGCFGQNADGTPTSWVDAWGTYPWSSNGQTGSLQGPTATVSVDPATTGYGTSGQVCTITGSGQANWLLPGTCVLDADNAGGSFDNNTFAAAPQIQTTTQIVGFVGSLSFASNVPAPARAGAAYTPSFTTGSPDGSSNPIGGRPASSPSPATPQVTIDSAQTSPAGACTTDGTTVTFVHVGTCVVSAFQPVDGVYGRTHVSSEQTIQITRGPQTIGFGSEASGTYIPGDTVSLNPTRGASGTPVALGIDPSSTANCSIDAQNQVSLQTPGACVIDAAETAGGDYLAATAKETLTVQNVHLAVVSALPCMSSYSLLTCVNSGSTPPPMDVKASSGTNLIMYVELQNSSGQPVVPDYGIPVTLASTGSSASSDPRFLIGTQFTTQATISAGSPAALVFYGDRVAGTDQVSAIGQVGGSQPTISSQTAPVTIEPGVVASLAWAQEPPDGVAGSALGGFDVRALDQYGNPVPGVQVSLSGADGDGNPVTIEQGTSATTDASGVAQFQGTEIDAAGAYSLIASTGSAGIATPASDEFTIATGTTQALTLTGGTAGGPLAAGASLPDVQAGAIDAGGNPVAGVPIRLTILENGATVTLASGRTGADGSDVVFHNLVISTPGSYAITAVDTDKPSFTDTLAPFTVTPFTTGLANVYVSASGNDAGDCVQATPCASVTGAEAELDPSGGTVHVSGTIDESAIDLNVPGVAVTGVPGTGATIDGQSSGSSIFTVDGSIGAGKSASISGLTLTDGYAGNGGNGGAIMDDSPGTVSVSNDVFTDDSADSGGGAIYTTGGGTLRVSDSTFDGDSAGVGAAVDGTENGAGGSITLLGSTFARNAASSSASAVVTGSGSSYYADDLFAGDCAGSGAWHDAGYNVFSDSSCYPDGGGNADVTSGFEAGEFTSSSTGGSLNPSYPNPATNLIPTGTSVTLGDGSTVDLCSATDAQALAAPHSIATSTGQHEVCNAGASQTAATSTPGQPTGVTGTGNPDGSLSVSWTAPSSFGGLPLSGYTVAVFDANGDNVENAQVGPSTTSDSFSGLAAGSYTTVITASNADGAGFQSFAGSPTAVGVAGSPAELSFLSAPGSATAGQPLGQFQVQVKDSQGAPVSGVAVTLVAAPASGTLAPPISGGSAVTNAQGTATFANATIDLSGSYALLASVQPGATAISSTPSQPFSVSADSAASVRFSEEPSDGVIGGTLPTYTVAVLDQYGNPVPNADVQITDADGNQIDDGQTDGSGDPAVFGLSRLTDLAELGSTSLTATVAGTALTATSTAFDLGPDLDAPTDVAVTNVNGTAHVSWTPPADPTALITGYTINAYDSNGDDAGGGVVGGAVTSMDITGFTGRFSFTVTANTELGVTGAQSAPSASTLIGPAGVPAQVLFTQMPATAQAGQALPEVQVTVLDADGDPVPNAPVTLSGTQVFNNGTTDSAGVATFSGDEIDQAGTYRLHAESAGQASGGMTYMIDADSPSFTVNAGTTASLEISWSASSIAGQPLTDVSVYAFDRFNQPAIGQSVTLSLIDTVTGQAPAGWQDVTAQAVSDGNGSAVALFHNVTVEKAGNYEFIATAGSTSTTSGSFTLTSVPAAPAGVTATANADGTATVAWSTPDDGGMPIEGYTITPYDANGDALTQTTINGSATSRNIDGLTPGDTYTFTVTAFNQDGLGPESAPTAATTIPANEPGAPTDVATTTGPGVVSVTWDPPSDRGDAALTGFTINAYDSNGQLAESQSVDANTGAVQFTDLTATNTYTFTAVATNAIGNGPESQPSSPVVVPAQPPDRPVSASVTSTVPGSALVTWTPPVDTGGAPVSSYTVTAVGFAGGATGGQTVTTQNGSATSALITGLTEGAEYYFSVAATTAGGTGSEQDSNTVVIVGAAPGAPTGVNVNPAAAGPQSEHVGWLPPTNQSFVAPTSYTVVAVDATNPANGGQTVTTGGSTFGTTISGLTGGDTYTFLVTAADEYGSGPAVSTDSVTAFNAPAAPRFVSAAPNPDGSVTITWTAPANNGGAPIAGYAVIGFDQTTSTNLGTVATTTGDTSVTVPGLGTGDTYAFSVQADTSYGSGPKSNSSSAIQTPEIQAPSVPDAPTNASAVENADASVTVSWTAPANQGSSSITGYTVTAYDGESGPNKTVSAAADATSAIITGLTVGDDYLIVVTADNDAGDSDQTLAGILTISAPSTTTIGTITTGTTTTPTDTTTTPTGTDTTPTDTTTTPTVTDTTPTDTTSTPSDTTSTPAATTSTPTPTPTPTPTATTASPAPTSLALTAVPPAFAYGHPITVKGTLRSRGSGVAGQDVALLYRPKGSTGAYKELSAKSVTNANGIATFAGFKPSTPVQIELRFAGTNSYAAATSSTANVAEELGITLRSSTKKATPKSTVKLTGAVAPAEQGKQVKLQVREGRRWVTVTTTKLTAASKYSFELKLPKLGRFSYRILVGSLGSYAQSTSPTLALTVS